MNECDPEKFRIHVIALFLSKLIALISVLTLSPSSAHADVKIVQMNIEGPSSGTPAPMIEVTAGLFNADQMALYARM